MRFDVFWSTVSVNFLLRKYYNYLNNIDMVLLRTSYICTGTSSNTILDYNLVRFGVCMIKLCHERMLILRCILPPPLPKNELPPEKKLTPQPPPEKSRTSWQETQVTGNILIPWETLSFWKNISLPPPAIKKRKSQSTRKRKNITPCKSFNHPKIASTIMKKPQTPHLKSSQFLKKP